MFRALALGIVLLVAPFVILGAGYSSLSAEVTVLRIPAAHAVMVAQKSLFVVFRVPLMNLIHGLMAAIMLSRAGDFLDSARRNSFARLFLTLLFTVAIKSNIEAVEMIAQTRGLGALTVLSVGAGVALAVFLGRRVRIPWTELRLGHWQKIALAGLFALYVGLVVASVLVAQKR